MVLQAPPLSPQFDIWMRSGYAKAARARDADITNPPLVFLHHTRTLRKAGSIHYNLGLAESLLMGDLPKTDYVILCLCRPLIRSSLPPLHLLKHASKGQKLSEQWIIFLKRAIVLLLSLRGHGQVISVKPSNRHLIGLGRHPASTSIPPASLPFITSSPARS